MYVQHWCKDVVAILHVSVGVSITISSIQSWDFCGLTAVFLFSSGRRVSESSGTHNIVFIYDDGKYDLVSSPVSVIRICICVKKELDNFPLPWEC